MDVFHKTPENIYVAEPLLALPWLYHGFGTRAAGETWVAPERLAMLNQMHSTTVIVADGRVGRVADGDALISALPGLMVGIRTADCLPVLVVDERRKVVAAVHSGWRGTVEGVLASTLHTLVERFESLPEDLHLAIGPGIGACCFEVGPEVAREFVPLFPEREDLNTRTRLDLAEAVHRQAVALGIPARRIYRAGLCTRCHAEEFHSYRRDGAAAGRMVSLAGIRA